MNIFDDKLFFFRCRPLNENEKAQRSYSVVDTPNSRFVIVFVSLLVTSTTTREITVKEKALSSLTKTFQFDKVFGIASKQLDVYRSVVEPLIGQVAPDVCLFVCVIPF